MGTYISYSDVLERTPGADDGAKLTRLEKLVGETGTTAVTTAVNAAIALAEGKIEGYAAVLYTVPLPANEMSANWALTIVEYELYKRASNAKVQEKYRIAYEDTIKELKDLSTGKLTISGATPPTPSTSGSGTMIVLGDDVMFDETNFVGF